MKINAIEYLRRVNKGNYEHEELKASAAIEDNEDKYSCFKSLKEFVEECLGLKENKEQLPLPIQKEAEVVKEELVVEEVKKKKERKSEVEKKSVKKINKATQYDRTLQTHKSLIGALLDTKYPKWKKGDLINKATQASQVLNGEDFLDENGDMLESFKAKFCEFMDK